MPIIDYDSNNGTSFINVILRIYTAFAAVITNNIFYILLIALLPRLQAYLIYTDKIGNWTATFLEKNSSITSQALQITLVLLQYVLIAAIYHRSTNPNRSFIESLISCLKKTHKIIIVIILYLVAVMLGIIAFILPGIYVMVLYSLAFISIIDTDVSVIAAFKNSKRLIRGNWFFSFFTIIAVISAPSLLFGFIGYKSSIYTTSVIFNEALIIFANIVSTIAMISGTLFLYQELIVRYKNNLENKPSPSEAPTPSA
jgi:hypothetical protein